MAMIRTIAVAALLCAVSIYQASGRGEVGCFDEHGNSVDWYIGYKFPRIKGSGRFDTGYVYAYITSENVAEDKNYDLPTSRPVVDYDSVTFLRHFRDLLEKFGGVFQKQTNRSPSRQTRSRIRNPPGKPIEWVASDRLITDPESVIMKTLDPAYREDLYDHISSVFYNDDPDNTSPEQRDDSDESDKGEAREASPSPGRKRKKKKSVSVAHAKGVLMMDEESNIGVWLTHSIPKFPNARDHFAEYPPNARLFGQTFMCVTFDLKKYGSNLVDHLVNMRPLVYDRKFTPTLLKEIPNLAMLDLYKPYQKVSSPSRLKQMITTKGGQALRLYSKSASFQEDLYGGWIDEDLGADLYVETWRRGSGNPLESSCPANEHHINNVKDLKYDPQVQWNYLVDHSKWAISDEESVATVCIGDANRMQSQFKRGSGAVCIKCPTCWSLFSNTILDTEPCPVRGDKGSRLSQRIDKSLSGRIDDFLHAAEK